MFELFANPANMIIGGALISSPIIIHLINRMRFKRIRWAAMEFLLKSQKRNRRRLIIEQLILLLLRIILVLLAGLLLARLLGANPLTGLGGKRSVHLILLDDRLSMNDQWKSKEEKSNSFQVARTLIDKEIAKNLLQNRSAQHVVLRRLSEPNTDLFDSRLNEDTVKKLSDTLRDMEGCTKLHLDLIRGIKAAEEMLGRHAVDQRSLYILSDFRQKHWSEPEAAELRKQLEGLKAAGVTVHLPDCADPKRSEGQKSPHYHDNLAIAELRPETRVAGQNVLVQFKFAVANFGAAERRNVRVTIKVNGTERAEASQTLASVPIGKPTEGTFLISFDQLGFNQVTAHLENEDYGINADNTRFAVIEIKKQVPVLVIDPSEAGNPEPKPGSDTFHLQSLLNAAKGFQIARGGVAELERANLDQYASIYLLNVRELANEKQLKNLEAYVRDGGGVAFFMGDRVTNADYYNKKLYADGAGLFPVPLAEQPSKALNEEEKLERLLQNLREPQYQLFIRKDDHPIFKFEADKVQNDKLLNQLRETFRFLTIDRYYPVPRLRWKLSDRVEELMTLPNTRPISDYEGNAQDILKELQVPSDDPRYVKYRPGLEYHRAAIRQALSGKVLNPLAIALENLLKDKGVQNNPDRPNLEEFWELSDAAIIKLRARVDKFRESVQMGDPLVVASRFGKGRVVAVLTSAGRSWNDWAAGGPASFTFPVIMLQMQKYLSSLGAEADLTVGMTRFFELDPNRYEAEMRCYFQPESKGNDAVKAEASAEEAPKATNLKDHDRQSGVESAGRLNFEFKKIREPGIYYFEMKQKPDMAGAPGKTETRAFAFNVDTTNESDLRRASKTDLERSGSKVEVVGDKIGESDRKNDLSETGWLYLAFLVILILEQALAVHLSFHLRGNEALPPQAVRPQPTTA